MFNLLTVLLSTDWIRLSVLYCHLLSCAFALTMVLSADWRIMSGSFDVAWLRRTAHNTAYVLLALWVTGLALVYHDTGLDPAVLATKPKLLLKLLTVSVLTVNGLVLHTISFPLIEKAKQPGLIQSLVLTITGALSTSHWLLAAFVGIARPLGQWPLQTLLMGYAIFSVLAIAAAIALTPQVRRRLATLAKSERDRVSMDVSFLSAGTNQ